MYAKTELVDPGHCERVRKNESDEGADEVVKL